jgi:hypothetical protein
MVRKNRDDSREHPSRKSLRPSGEHREPREDQPKGWHYTERKPQEAGREAGATKKTAAGVADPNCATGRVCRGFVGAGDLVRMLA